MTNHTATFSTPANARTRSPASRVRGPHGGAGILGAILLTLLVLLGASPLAVHASDFEDRARWVAVGVLGAYGLCVAVALLKGKLQLGVLGIFCVFDLVGGAPSEPR